MSALVWDESWETGHPLIDFDHRTLVDLVNRLRALLSTEADLKAIDHFMVRLNDLVHKHLQREEDILRHIDFPDFSEHVKDHRNIASQFEIFSNTWQRAPEALDLHHVLSFVEDWLDRHARHEFASIAAHLSARNA
ncbi:hypothetical protein JCM17960_32020 [Magnetospira thiophila]